ncbi:hypothetical protein ACWEF6_01730 [Amycolatopsis sp. NPDC004772]
MLKTPTSNLGSNGGPQLPEKRKAGGHGPTLEDEVYELSLLPTPLANMNGASKPEIAAGNPYGRLETEVAILSIGGNTDQPSADGRTSSEYRRRNRPIADPEVA